MKLSIKLTPESQRKINALAKAGKLDLRPTMNVVGKGYRKEVGMIFDHEQPRGEKDRWAPLSDQYAAWKAKRFPGAPILVQTGALRRSMTSEGAPGNINTIGKTGAVFGTSIPYGIYHDSDGQRKSKLPRRNFSEPSDRRRGIWMRQIEDNIRKNFTDNGINVEGGIMA